MQLNLKDQFGGDFASTAFQRVDGEPRIVGKFGSIAQLETGEFDVWFVGPNLKPLGGRKLAAIKKKFPKEHDLIVVTGEAYARGHGAEFVRQVAPLCGIRKRRRVSAKERERLRQQAAKARESIAA